MGTPDRKPRILMVTPEVTFVPQKMEPGARSIAARAGGLGDICSAQIHGLFEQGADVHLAMPNYRNVFKNNEQRQPEIDIRGHSHKLPENRIHLAQDRSFFYHPKLFMNTDWDNIRLALAFQREVIHRIIPEVRPDLIHCYDWMTGLVPAMARRMGIPCVFTLYRLDSPRLSLAAIEDRGIDAAAFWEYGFYSRMPLNYEETRETNPLDLLVSGVFAADLATTLSRTFMDALTRAYCPKVKPWLKAELVNKLQAGRLRAVPPAPDASFDPATDRSLLRPYGPESHYAGKAFNKLQLQEALGLPLDSAAPVCFWPTRLDGGRAGCLLMADALPGILERYRDRRLQLVFIADGDFQENFRTRINQLQARDRVAVSDFNARRYRLAYAGSDFVLMPLHLDPCALPAMIGQRYGALPVAHDAGAIHDCVTHIDTTANRGSGFLFETFDVNGLMWALDQAMGFYSQPSGIRAAHLQRIMTDSLKRFDPDIAVRRLIDLYAIVHAGFRAGDRNSSDLPSAARMAA
ncbi:glycogen/starch synthase [uncultured Desulfosarcina sp.]|uniref:glycogen synthase n=1 Tax=uncultured Desulfosarcina sp. TaxID=218289 RepID=UPI0029C6E314|nr:glycogen/starch synthase [uncultured Desulfosarcina sp.]